MSLLPQPSNQVCHNYSQKECILIDLHFERSWGMDGCHCLLFHGSRKTKLASPVDLLEDKMCYRFLFTCVVLVFVIDCWADSLDRLAEAWCRPLSWAGSSGFDWTCSCPGNGSETQTKSSAWTNETATSPGLCSCPALHCIFRGDAFETVGALHLTIRMTKILF